MEGEIILVTVIVSNPMCPGRCGSASEICDQHFLSHTRFISFTARCSEASFRRGNKRAGTIGRVNYGLTRRSILEVSQELREGKRWGIHLNDIHSKCV